MDDLSHVPFDAVQELHKQAEACLSGTIQLATAADQRATTLVGIFGAGSIALLAAIATLLSAAGPKMPAIGAAATMAFLLFIAAVTAAMATAPTDFHVGGYEPKRIAHSASDVAWMLRYAVDDLQIRIDVNRGVLARSAKLIRVAMAMALGAIPIGILVFSALREGLRSF